MIKTKNQKLCFHLFSRGSDFKYRKKNVKYKKLLLFHVIITIIDVNLGQHPQFEKRWKNQTKQKLHITKIVQINSLEVIIAMELTQC